MVRACDPAKSGDNLSIQRNEYLGLEAQAETIRPWRWSTTGLIDIIVDGGESAKSLNRPGMARLLALVDAGDVKTVIIAKLDRLTRSVKDLWHAAGALRAARCRSGFGSDKNILRCGDQGKGQWVTASPSRECRPPREAQLLHQAVLRWVPRQSPISR
jgi:hypothetical protein